MCRDEVMLQSIWSNLYESKLGTKLNDVDDCIVGPYMLIERTIIAFKELGQSYVNTLKEVNDIKTKFDSATSELKVLKEKLNETLRPCQNCDVLAKDLSLAKKKAKEAEFRVTQIAKILVGQSDDVAEEDSASPVKSSKRKRARNRSQDENSPRISSQEVEVGFSISPRGSKEKDAPDKPLTPKKPKSPKDVYVKKKKLSLSADFEGSPVRKVSPRRNLSADFGLDNPALSPNKLKEIGNEDKNANVNSKKICLNDSFSKSSKKWCSDPDKYLCDDDLRGNNKNSCKENLAFGIAVQEPAGDVFPSTSGSIRVKDEISPRTWRQKKHNRSFRSNNIIKNSDNSYDLIFEKKVPKKKFKQLTLQIQPSNKQTNDVESDLEEIVLPSPEKIQEENFEMAMLNDDLDCTFNPGSTSTQRPDTAVNEALEAVKVTTPQKSKVKKPASNRQLDNSFDVVLDRRRTTPSPNYKYKAKTVRGKARAQLQGWDCDDCKKFYELACKDQSPSKVRAKMNICSRHRSKHKNTRPPTPPGFWDLDIPDTPE